MSVDFIKWNDNIYSVGNDVIDNEHKELIQIINKLFNAFSEGKAEDIVPEIIKELSNYTQNHFKTEEDLFETHNYPDKDVHIAKHQDFINQIEIWKNKIKQGEKNIHYELMDFLKTWITEHIQKDDRSYNTYFKEKNIRI